MPPRLRHLGNAEQGFTLIELLAAMFLLVVGILALFATLDSSAKVSQITRAREGAVALAREITEDARAIPYAQLTPSTIVSSLEAFPGLATTSSTGWQVTRPAGGVTYTITATVCSIDDPKDGYGVHDSTFCSDSSTTGTTDPQPADFKRVTVNLSWTTATQSHSLQEVATIASTGQAVSTSATNLVLASPAVGTAGVAGTASQPVISSTAVTGLTFSVTAPTGTTSIVWTVNGGVQSWTSTTSGSTWTSSSWSIASLSDGSYTVAAQAQNASGAIGPAVSIPVTLARTTPSAPTVNDYGFNANSSLGATQSTVAELEWQPDPELNVSGYRIYSVVNGASTLICTTTPSLVNSTCGPNGGTGTGVWCSTATACIDLNPATTSYATYKVAAIYHDATGAVAEGPATTVTLPGYAVISDALAASSGNAGTNCTATGTTSRDLLAGSSYTPGTDNTQTAGTIMFCTGAFAAGQFIGSGGTATAYFANTGNSSCTIGANENLNVTGGGITASPAVSIPANSAVTKYSFTFPPGSPASYTFAAGDKLDVQFAMSGNSCKSTVIHYASSTYPGSFISNKAPLATPSPIASGVTLTLGTGNQATLSWSPPSSTVPIRVYRIYRDGAAYSNRLDYVDASTCSTSCTWTDSNHAGSHTYYVTAVGNGSAGTDESESASVSVTG